MVDVFQTTRIYAFLCNKFSDNLPFLQDIVVTISKTNNKASQIINYMLCRFPFAIYHTKVLAVKA